MRVITQEDINCDIRERASFQKNTRELSEVVLDKYGLNSHYSLDAKIAIMNQLPSIYFSLDKQLTGKRILDLGCGSKNPTIEFNVANPRKYEPWLCRALLETSAKPIGIDVGYLGYHQLFFISLIKVLI